MIAFACECGQKYRMSDGTAGMVRPCKKCGRRLQVPFEVSEPSSGDDTEADADTYIPSSSSVYIYEHSEPAPSIGAFGILSIAFGCLAVLVFPPLCGLAGFVLGIIGLVMQPQKATAIIGIIISVVGAGIGMVIGAIVGMR